MGSFQYGFKMGADAYEAAERNKLLKEQNAREAEAHRLRMEEGNLRVAGLRRVDDATNDLDRITRLGILNPEAKKANDEDFDAAVEATGRGLPMPAAAPQQPEWRKATGLELNDARARLAAARGDIAGLEALDAGRKRIEFDEGYKKHFEDWNKMDDTARGELINKLSYDAGVKGFGTWTPGKGKQAGYMTYLPPTGDAVKLSAKEAGDLYALTNLMSVDPMRARAEMDKVSDKVRAVAAQAFEAQTKGVTANNTAAHYGNQDAIAGARLANERTHMDILREQLRRPQAANLREFVNDKGESVMVDIAGLPRSRDGTIAMPQGLKPRTTKPTVTPDAYFQALERANNVYGDPAKARMAVDQMFGLTAPTAQVAETLKALNDKKGGVKNQSAPAAAAPTPQLGLTQRLGSAIGTDNTTGNRNQFDALAAEAEQAVPTYTQQISVLRNALGSARSPSERANLENRIGELEQDLTIYSSILQQRAAQRGY